MNRPLQKTIRLITITSDLLLINLGVILAYLARYQWEWWREVEPQNLIPFRTYWPQQLLLNIVLIIAFSQSGVWRRRRGESWFDEVYRLAYTMAGGFMAVMAYQFLVRPPANSRLMMFWAALFIGMLIGLARLVRRFILQRAYRRGRWTDEVLIVGEGEAGRGVIRTLLARPDLGYQAMGFLDDGRGELGSKRIPYLGAWTGLQAEIKAHPNLHTVFIALSADKHQEILELTKLCLASDIEAKIVPDLFQLSLGRVEMSNMAGIPIVGIRDIYQNPLSRFLKRVIDLICVAIFAPLALLLTGIIAIAIKLEDGGTLFYPAKRIGRGGKPFAMYKFRSMVPNADALRAELWAQNEAEGAIFKIKDDPRVTKVGKIIRKLSLDELPQLYNIAIGDMSFVGPRPPIQDEVDQYKTWHHRRLEVMGGLTGLWQISGRADLTFDEAALLDIYYIENWSLMMDLRIVLETVPYILFGHKGAY